MFFWTEAPTPNGPESQPGVEEDVADKEEEGSEDEWEQVGPRNKTSITRQADFVRTPITDIFGGHIRYVGGSLCEATIMSLVFRVEFWWLVDLSVLSSLFLVSLFLKHFFIVLLVMTSIPT